MPNNHDLTIFDIIRAGGAAASAVDPAASAASAAVAVAAAENALAAADDMRAVIQLPDVPSDTWLDFVDDYGYHRELLHKTRGLSLPADYIETPGWRLGDPDVNYAWTIKDSYGFFGAAIGRGFNSTRTDANVAINAAGIVTTNGRVTTLETNYTSHGHGNLTIDSNGIVSALGGEIRTGDVGLAMSDVGVLLRFRDNYGYYRRCLDSTGALFPGTEIENDIWRVINEPGITFAVRDLYGYAPVAIRAGETLSNLTPILARITALETGGASGFAPYGTSDVVVTPHRGNVITGAPEDSLDSIRIAARCGYTHGEGDARITSDGEFVIMHDADINRTCKTYPAYGTIVGSVVVAATTLADLRANYVLASTVVAYRRPIPTLEEYVMEHKRLGLIALIELKDALTNPQIVDLVERCVNIIGWHGVRFNCFFPAQLDYIRTLYPYAQLDYTYTTLDTTKINHIATNEGRAFIEYTALTQSLVAEAHRANVKVSCWTPPNAALDALVEMGVDEVCSDRIGPKLSNQALAYSVHTDAGWGAFALTGDLANGIVTLDSAESIILSPSTQELLPFGAYWVTIEYTGDLTVAAPRLAATAISNAGADWRLANFQTTFINSKMNLTILATAAAQVKSITISVARL